MVNSIKTTWVDLPAHVTLIGVTKTFPFETIAYAHAMGIRHMGENRVEEANEKIMLAKQNGFADITWHMIGHVQSRKIKQVVGLFDWVDSVDSVELAKKLNKEAIKIGKRIDILLEVNISGEEGKFGFNLMNWEMDQEKLNQFIAIIREIMAEDHIKVRGLMTMAPFTAHPENNRPVFHSMGKLSKTIRTQIPDFGSVLSMGTSGDYRVAIEEGATQVRLGEALFGARVVAKALIKQV
jgi:PLP dependent protein